MIADSPAFKQLAAANPDDELIIYRNDVFRFECVIAVPRARITAKKSPLWRHGDTIHVKPARVTTE